MLAEIFLWIVGVGTSYVGVMPLAFDLGYKYAGFGGDTAESRFEDGVFCALLWPFLIFLAIVLGIPFLLLLGTSLLVGYVGGQVYRLSFRLWGGDALTKERNEP